MSLQKAFEKAGRQIGMNEREQNAALSEYMRNGGQNLDPAVTAWCAAYVNASLEQAGIDGTGSWAARSFMDWGQPTDTPQRGDIAVFSRGDPNGWQGHVGFFDGYGDDGRVRVLGGNQSDSVSLAYYDPNRLLGFRTAAEAEAAGVTGPAPATQEFPLGAQDIRPPPYDGPPQNALAEPDPRQRMAMEYANALRQQQPHQEFQPLDAQGFMAQPPQYAPPQNAFAQVEYRPRYLTRR